MSKQGTWHETLYEHFGQYFTVNNVLYHAATGQQDLVIFENIAFGRMLALDGVVQTTECDEFIYHEMMAHVPLIAHVNAKKVLIIGGGDGGLLREVSCHPSVEKITMVEIDAAVVTFCKKYLPRHNAGAFEDPRFTLIVGNGIDFVSQSSEKFDIIISDCTDPIGLAKSLFTPDFYRGCARCLNEDGIFVAQSGVFFLQQHDAVNTYRTLQHYFSDVSFYQAAVPTYYGGIMIFAWASQNPALRQIDTAILKARIDKTGLTCRYYNAAIHKCSFVLPQYLVNAL